MRWYWHIGDGKSAVGRQFKMCYSKIIFLPIFLNQDIVFYNQCQAKVKPLSEMYIRKLALTAIAMLFVIVFFNISHYRKWLDERILVLTEEWYEQSDKKTYEDRRAYRLGNGYVACKSIATYVRTQKIKNPLILLPPDTYNKKLGYGIVIPEPVIFYYMTGLKATRPGNADVSKANYFVDGADGNVMVTEVKNADDIKKILSIYQSFK